MFKKILKTEDFKSLLMFFSFIIIPNVLVDIYFIINHSVAFLGLMANQRLIWDFSVVIGILNLISFFLFEKEFYLANMNIEAKIKSEAKHNILLYFIFSVILLSLSICINVIIYKGLNLAWILVLIITLYISTVVSLYGEEITTNINYKNILHTRKGGIFTNDIFTESIFISFAIGVIYFVISAVILGITHIFAHIVL